MLANPFGGVRVKAATKSGATPAARAFSDRKWKLVRSIADALDEHGWTADAGERLRFVLDFAYATGLRSGEFVRAQLVHIELRRGRPLVDRGRGQGQQGRACRRASPCEARAGSLSRIAGIAHLRLALEARHPARWTHRRRRAGLGVILILARFVAV